jgi:hypothetical protein
LNLLPPLDLDAQAIAIRFSPFALVWDGSGEKRKAKSESAKVAEGNN